jgi:hypothetical protein
MQAVQKLHKFQQHARNWQTGFPLALSNNKKKGAKETSA